MNESVVEWYAVRCIFAVGWPPEGRDKTYEERITLWRAASFGEAIARAEQEATEYTSTIDESPDTYLDIAQAFRLSDEPGDGAEVLDDAVERPAPECVCCAVLRDRSRTSTTTLTVS